jgi:hypothetical protein
MSPDYTTPVSSPAPGAKSCPPTSRVQSLPRQVPCRRLSATREGNKGRPLPYADCSAARLEGGRLACRPGTSSRPRKVSAPAASLKSGSHWVQHGARTGNLGLGGGAPPACGWGWLVALRPGMVEAESGWLLLVGRQHVDCSERLRGSCAGEGWRPLTIGTRRRRGAPWLRRPIAATNAQCGLHGGPSRMATCRSSVAARARRPLPSCSLRQRPWHQSVWFPSPVAVSRHRCTTTLLHFLSFLIFIMLLDERLPCWFKLSNSVLCFHELLA